MITFSSKFLRMPYWTALLLLCAAKAHPAILEGELKNQAGQPVANAVIVATPSQAKLANESDARSTVELDQRNREFMPHVLAVRTGTEVKFPNHDQIRHHVYSFSTVKRFEIKLYKGTPPNPIRFDTAGIAVLGCNIHDWMIAYVYVTDTPYFTKTDGSGRWSLDVPADIYKIGIWHPHMDTGETLSSEPLTVTEHQTIRLDRILPLKKSFRTGKPPTSLLEEGYKGEP